MIQIRDLKKSYGNLDVLKGINLDVKKGEVVSIIGPSGTGKSTLLRCINLIETPDNGSIYLDGIKFDVSDSSEKQIQNIRKKTSMVFQNYCLFKNKTVLENIIIPMILVHKEDKIIANKKAMVLLEKVGLADKKNEYPIRLSGGQQQRVGIARALAVEPKVILFDEPTSSLDPELVEGVLDIIKEVAKERECTMIIVTHEMNFAINISDKLIFMDNGYIVEMGTPNELLYNAKNEKTKLYLKV